MYNLVSHIPILLLALLPMASHGVFDMNRDYALERHYAHQRPCRLSVKGVELEERECPLAASCTDGPLELRTANGNVMQLMYCAKEIQQDLTRRLVSSHGVLT